MIPMKGKMKVVKPDTNGEISKSGNYFNTLDRKGEISEQFMEN